MQLTVKLLPPYCKPGAQGELRLELPADRDRWDLRQLAEYLSRERADLIAYPLMDKKGILTAEFMVNGKHAPVDRLLEPDDAVTVIPYICGG